jgi:hypothetical protein
MPNKNILFKNLEGEELAKKPQNEIAHFGWEGGGSFAFEMIAQSYYEGAETLFEKIQAAGNDFAVIDSLIYPMAFLYRHFIELYLKGLYLKYSGETEENIKSYLDRASHNLMASWNEVKPFFSKGKKHVGSTVNIDGIEKSIRSMNKFDPTSMGMRYPIDKNLDELHPKAIHLDYIEVHNQMVKLHESLLKIDADIDGQVKNIADEVNIESFLEHYHKWNSKLDFYLLILQKEMETTHNEEDFEVVSIFEHLDELSDEEESIVFYEESDDDFKIIVEVLYYVGRDLRTNGMHLSKNKAEKKKEFVTCCLNHMKAFHLRFSGPVDINLMNAYTKSPDAIYNNISMAREILSFSLKV